MPQIEDIQWAIPEQTEFRHTLFHEGDKELHMITRPFHPIQVIYRVMNGKKVYWQGVVIGVAVDRYNEI